jgi:hypothetical protein
MGCIELPSKNVKGRSEMQYSFKLGMPSIVEKCRHRGVVQKRGFVRIELCINKLTTTCVFVPSLRLMDFYFLLMHNGKPNLISHKHP